MGQLMSPASLKRRGLKVCFAVHGWHDWLGGGSNSRLAAGRSSSMGGWGMALFGLPCALKDHPLTLLSPLPPLPLESTQAASFHKTSIDTLLHPRQMGANPYRIVLGEVRHAVLGWAGLGCVTLC